MKHLPSQIYEDDLDKNYLVTFCGLIVKNWTGKVMYQQSCKNGYKRVWLTINGKRSTFLVHRLVAERYVKGKTKNKCDVNHIDGDKSNNDFRNLAWVTKSCNQKHAYANGLQPSRKGRKYNKGN